MLLSADVQPIEFRARRLVYAFGDNVLSSRAARVGLGQNARFIPRTRSAVYRYYSPTRVYV